MDDRGLESKASAGSAQASNAVGRGRGLTNGSGRTNGGGLTNGSGRTNGSGFTNGSGRTNGSGGRIPGRRAIALGAARRTRRRAVSFAAAALVVAMSLGAAIGLTGAPDGGPRIDGELGDWAGALRPAPAAATHGVGLVAFGVRAPDAGPAAGAFTFLSPFDARADIWLFIDTDLDASTGFYDGSIGADAAVVVRTDGGRALASTAMRFSGEDAFDLNGLSATGPAAAVLRGAALEAELPAVPRALSVAVAGPDSAASSGAFDLAGQPVFLEPPAPPRSDDVRNGVRIDGDFSDWRDIPRVEEQPTFGLPGRLDILSAAAIGDDASAQFYLSARSAVLMGTVPLRASPVSGAEAAPGPSAPAPPRRVAGTDLLEVYLDTDRDRLTGTPAYGLGADALLRVEGVRGRVVVAEAFTFDAQGWSPAGVPAEAAAAGGELEASVALTGLVGADARFVLQGFEGARDVNVNPVAVGRQAGGAGTSISLSPAAEAPSAPDAEVNPIPELSDVLALSAGVFLIFAIQRSRRRPRAGPERGA